MSIILYSPLCCSKTKDFFIYLIILLNAVDPLKQWYSNLAGEIHFPAEFSSNPNQTHLSVLINVFRIIRKSQEGEFDQGLS